MANYKSGIQSRGPAAGDKGTVDQMDVIPEPHEALLGLLLAQLDGPVAIPARAWPVTSACELLARRLPTSSMIGGLAQAAVRRPCSDSTVEAWFRHLVAIGGARPCGRGYAAHWQVDEAWRLEWRAMLDLVEETEGLALREAGEALQRSLSIAAKIGLAASSSSASSTSAT